MSRPGPIDARAGVRHALATTGAAVHLARPDRLPVGGAARTLCGRLVSTTIVGTPVYHDEQCGTCWRVAGAEAPAP